ncbi:MAG TPA: hypothetical protein VN814_01490 [Caulobacteraceae bacterium]|nr:hypothetical protein [Caulobacteraceae bacterium]
MAEAGETATALRRFPRHRLGLTALRGDPDWTWNALAAILT